MATRIILNVDSNHRCRTSSQFGSLPLAKGEGVQSTLLTWDHMKIIQKSWKSLGHSMLQMERGAKHSPHMSQKLTTYYQNLWSWKWTRTCKETCWSIMNYQGWHLTRQDFIKRDSKKLILRSSRFSRFWQNRAGCSASVVRFRPEVNTVGIYVENHEGRCQ